MNQMICNLLDFYQKRIGSYDNQFAWEKPLDTIFIKNNFYCLSAKKSFRVEDQIDIDLIKGSQFTKTKSKLSLPSVFINGTKKLLFYPVYFNWWQYHTNLFFAILLLLVYFLQLANLLIYYYDGATLIQNGKPLITITEILTPTIIMLILFIMYTFITSALPVCNEKDKYAEQSNISTMPKKSTKDSDTKLDTNKETQSSNSQSEKTDGSDDSISIEYLNNDTDKIKKTDTFYKQVYLTQNENEFYSEDDFDLSAASDSDQTDITYNLNDSISSGKQKTKTQHKLKTRNYMSDTEKCLRSGSFSFVKKKISCIMWETNEWKGVDLSMNEISNYIQTNVKKASFSLDYFYIGIVFSIIIGFLPMSYHYFLHHKPSVENATVAINSDESLIESLVVNSASFTFLDLTQTIKNNLIKGAIKSKITNTAHFWINVESKAIFVICNTIISTIILSMLFFSILTIADKTLTQRFLHAKYFCYLTSHRRAKKHNLPHFRLGKVENIKMWLSLRSFMKRHGPQRSIDAIISSTFLIGVALCSIVCIRFLQDSDFLNNSLFDWQLVVWCFCIWTYMLRFMTIGFKTNKKYRNCMSMVITEQINLYLQMEKKPECKDELTVVNNVLKLASDLLKEIENPFKISGLGVNPMVYNITKVVILSAFSAVMSELLGFKLKLYKIKMN